VFCIVLYPLMLNDTLEPPNLQSTSVIATMSGLLIVSLDCSSLNLLVKESALVYQHFNDLYVATESLRLLVIGLESQDKVRKKKLN